MSTVTERFACTERFVFHQLDWQAYERLLDAVGDRRLRHTYDEGVLEIMSPSYAHENYKEFFTLLVTTLTEELGLEFRSAGSLRMKLSPKDTGVEADACFFISHERTMRGKREWDPQRDPPPDLAIEIDVSNSSVPRRPVYAKLRVPEIWCYDGEKLTFLELNATGHYTEVDESLTYAKLRPEHLERLLDELPEHGQLEIVKKFRSWIHGYFDDPAK